MNDTKNRIQALLVRVILILHSFLTIWRLATVKENNLFWFLGLANIFIVFEAGYTVVKRKGNESKWFCPCFLLYLFSTLPAILLLELDKLQTYDNMLTSTNVSQIKEETLVAIEGITLPIALKPEVWISLLEQTLVFILIIGRWLLPRGKLSRDQLSQLLFVYIGAGSDILELFVVFEEAEVRKDKVLSYITLAVWSLSLLQFTLIFTAIKSHHKNRNVGSTNEDNKQNDDIVGRLLGTEIWSLLLSTILMDLPFMCVRLYILITMHVFSYGILFFTCKNIILILVVIYRIIILCVNVEGDNNSTKENAVSPEKQPA